jgi:hypothetical protein
MATIDSMSQLPEKTQFTFAASKRRAEHLLNPREFSRAAWLCDGQPPLARAFGAVHLPHALRA